MQQPRSRNQLRAPLKQQQQLAVSLWHGSCRKQQLQQLGGPPLRAVYRQELLAAPLSSLHPQAAQSSCCPQASARLVSDMGPFVSIIDETNCGYLLLLNQAYGRLTAAAVVTWQQDD